MSATIGILMDASGSMADSITVPDNYHLLKVGSGSRQLPSTESWERSMLKVVDNLIKHDVHSKTDVFAIVYGARSEPVTSDVLNTLKANLPTDRGRNEDPTIRRILTILKEHGAPRIEFWAKMDVLTQEIPHDKSKFILKMLEDYPGYRAEVVKCLPNECRVAPESFFSWGKQILAVTSFQRPTRTEMLETIHNILNIPILDYVAVRDDSPSKVSVSEAHDVLHDSADETNLTGSQVTEPLNAIEPCIYGATSMKEALKEAASLFKSSTNSNKVLFVLSDGIPTDCERIPNFDESDVKVVCCYITEHPETDPKRLYCTENDKWRADTKFMFRLSSSVPTQSLPRTIFIKRDWKIDNENNETKLFFQVNHPDLIKEVCTFARDVISSKDALCDVLSSVCLDLYINKANEGFGAKQQEGGTCYANASATVLHLAMKRIVGRDRGYPDFYDLRKNIIEKHGKYGANTFAVLQDICPQYRLYCQKTDIKGALKAVAAKRPVVARFSLTKLEWKAFKTFYRKNPKGVLTKSDIGHPEQESIGHAVVLVSYNSRSLRFMNSWGTSFADKGFFRVCGEVLGLEFIDVFWKPEDLKPGEIAAYQKKGPKIAKKLLSDLRGLNNSVYKCPLCERESPVTEFKGKLVQAKCPKCNEVFDVNEHNAPDLVLNMYLTSLCD